MSGHWARISLSVVVSSAGIAPLQIPRLAPTGATYAEKPLPLCGRILIVMDFSSSGKMDQDAAAIIRCADCGIEIAASRLRLLDLATLCLQCQERLESDLHNHRKPS